MFHRFIITIMAVSLMAVSANSQVLEDRPNPDPKLDEATVTELNNTWERARNPNIVVLVGIEKSGIVQYEGLPTVGAGLRSVLISELTKAMPGAVFDPAMVAKRDAVIWSQLERDDGKELTADARLALKDAFDADIVIDVTMMPSGSGSSPTSTNRRSGRSSQKTSYIPMLRANRTDNGAYIATSQTKPVDFSSAPNLAFPYGVHLLKDFAEGFIRAYPPGGPDTPTTYTIQLLAAGGMDGFDDRLYRDIRETIENRVRKVKWADTNSVVLGSHRFAELEVRYAGRFSELLSDIEDLVLPRHDVGWSVQGTQGTMATVYLFEDVEPKWYQATNRRSPDFARRNADRIELLPHSAPRVGIVIGADINEPLDAFEHNGTDLMTSGFFEDEMLAGEMAQYFREMGFQVVSDDLLRNAFKSKIKTSGDFTGVLTTLAELDAIDYLVHVNVLEQGSWRGFNAHLYEVASELDLSFARFPNPAVSKTSRYSVNADSPEEVARFLMGRVLAGWDSQAIHRVREIRVQVRHAQGIKQLLEIADKIRDSHEAISEVDGLQINGTVGAFSVLSTDPSVLIEWSIVNVIGKLYPGAEIDLLSNELLINLKPTVEMKMQTVSVDPEQRSNSHTQEEGKRREISFAKILDQASHAVYMIGVETDGAFLLGGTAWAFEHNKLATNAHVVEGVLKSYREKIENGKTNVKIVAIGGPTNEERLVLDPMALIHQEYIKSTEKNDKLYNFLISQFTDHLPGNREEVAAELRKSAGAPVSEDDVDVEVLKVKKEIEDARTTASGLLPVSAGDVGVFQVSQGRPSELIELAPRNGLNQRILRGEQIGYIGYPGDNLMKITNYGMVAQQIDIGTITSITDFETKPGTLESRRLIHYTLTTAGGASGSPVLNAKGQVVALNSAGSYLWIDDTRIRTGFAYGQRIDFLYELLDGQSVKVTPENAHKLFP